jgi:hypothetical protein
MARNPKYQTINTGGGSKGGSSPGTGGNAPGPAVNVPTVKTHKREPVERLESPMASPEDYFGPNGPGAIFMQFAQQVEDPTNDYIRDAQLRALETRGRQQAAVDVLGDRARGGALPAHIAMRTAMGRAQGAAAQQAAARNLSPAAQVAAIRQLAGAGAGIGGQTAGMAADERLGSIDTWLGAASQMRGQDIGQQGLEADWFTRQSQHDTMKQQMMAKYLQLGLNAQQAADQADRDELRMYLAAKSGDMQLRQQAQQLALQNRQMRDAALMGTIGGMADAATAYQRAAAGGGWNDDMDGDSWWGTWDD